MTRLLAISVLGLASACSEPEPDLEAVLLAHLEVRGHSAKPIDLDFAQWEGYRRALELTADRTEEEIGDTTDPSGTWRGDAVESLIYGANLKRPCEGTVNTGAPFTGPRIANLCRIGLHAAEFEAKRGDTDRAKLIVRSLVAMNVDLMRHGDQELQMVATHWSLLAVPLEPGGWSPEERGRQAHRAGKWMPWDDPLIDELFSELVASSVSKERTLLAAMQNEGAATVFEAADVVDVLQRKWELENANEGRPYRAALQLAEEVGENGSASDLLVSDLVVLEQGRRIALAHFVATQSLATGNLLVTHGMPAHSRDVEGDRRVSVFWAGEAEEPLLFVVPD